MDPHNRFTVFGVHIEALVNTETQRPVTLEDLHELRLNMPLRLALADLRLAIRYPDDMEHFAFRAIESIRQHFVESGGKPSDSWKRLRDALRIDRSWIESIKDAATARRHGETGALFISGPEQGRILETARGVIDRFCLFLKSPDAVRALPTLRIDESPPGKVDS